MKINNGTFSITSSFIHAKNGISIAGNNRGEITDSVIIGSRVGLVLNGNCCVTFKNCAVIALGEFKEESDNGIAAMVDGFAQVSFEDCQLFGMNVLVAAGNARITISGGSIVSQDVTKLGRQRAIRLRDSASVVLSSNPFKVGRIALQGAASCKTQ